MIQSVDESVGRIVAKLEELKLAENTVVIFSSDNGGVGGYGTTEPPSEKKGFTDNAPLRGGKGTLYEGGIRVPFIVRWPGVVKPGTTNDTPLAHVDVYPTFLEICGGKKPTDRMLDGKSFLPLLKNSRAKFSRNPIYWHFPGYLQSYVHNTGFRTTPVGVIHSGDFKLMEFFEDNRIELYNLREDIGEKNNLASTNPKRVNELRVKLAAWRKEISAEMPTMKDGASVSRPEQIEKSGNRTKKNKK
jgi:arylsulfatase A-like enzyme